MLIGAAMMPHGNPVLNPEDEETRKLAEALKEIGKELSRADVYVLISPHNVRMSEVLGIIMAENLISWLGFGGVQLPGEYKTDKELARKIYLKAKAKDLPVVDINFASLSGEYSRFPLTWGELIPLQFLEKRPVVLLTPARHIPKETLVKFGEVVGEVLENYEKKVAFIASADHAHAHGNGPYGYAPEAKEYDELIMRIIQENRLEELLEIPDDLINKALPDSYWQLLVLYGVLKKVPMKVKRTAYACPSYFGMGAALFIRE
ncbi:extradiol dioxygenase [Thermococcus bergensis]|uniref:DODA-type extradiol aromatic ring-opening family dioxygenase n=1 Tax=Thermococcus bergensis TaxID=2689387 RepID=UPI001CEDDEC1|nr:extradiol dioxygenase [Thermococcus bergensis]MCA6214782.1 extradiol dioxygenase [Thermococcus bergensis]